ncbi:hypothetical protein [Prosthecobacter vanneervenii]|uniref:Uncharacterized protein n=1 Tax=Prosthecobacter vanneervenii TaxID=48466 RepID=A0A7W7Y8E5_9BACT|nr:hypothetical protein [Prosthecobacter vanneervenii]MBB5031511.1 hypothetical protein [Prosthecobacter vanneervenii]
MNKELSQDVMAMIIGLSIVSIMFLLSLGRMLALYRSNRRLSAEGVKMNKQLAIQEMEVTGAHHDSKSWRAKMQRQFDALRAELSTQLVQTEMNGAHALKELDKACQQVLTNSDAKAAELAAAKIKISELEAALAVKPVAVPPPPPPSVPKPALPALPAMETLRIQALETELAAVKSELALAKQQNASLQLTALLARRKAPVVTAHARKSTLLRGRNGRSA